MALGFVKKLMLWGSGKGERDHRHLRTEVIITEERKFIEQRGVAADA